jgi:hypothetical protein
MSFRSAVLFISSVVLLLAAVGCQGTLSSISPDLIARDSQDFSAPTMIFPFGHKDVDLSVLVYGGPDLPPGVDFGDQVKVADSWYFTAMVSLNATTNSPRLVWLKEGDPPTTIIAPSQGGVYKSPKLDACYFHNPETQDDSIIEVAICYQIRDTVNHDWDIGFSTFRWHLLDFPEGIPVEYQHIFPDTEGDPQAGQFNDYTPDIAYDNENGDLYLVWTRYDPTLIEYPARLNYRWFERSSGGWSNVRKFYDDEHPHAQWLPRIDVGRTGFFDGDMSTVGVVYTSKGLYHDSFEDNYHAALAYWHTHDYYDDHWVGQFAIVVPEFADTPLQSGLPVCEVAPNSDYANWGIVGFVQEVPDNLIDPDYEEIHFEAYVTDSLSNSFCPIHTPPKSNQGHFAICGYSLRS